METQVEAPESISPTKPEREDKELLNEVTSINFFPDEDKKPELKPNQSLEASNYEEQTANRPFATKIELDQENAVTEADMGTNHGETFLNSPPIPEVATNDSSSTPKEYEATKTKDQAEVCEIETHEEEILKDQRVDITASKEASDEQRPITEEKLEESQRDEREYVTDELEQGERLSESSSVEVKEVWLNNKENEGPNVEDTDESTAKQRTKNENFKGQLLESASEETVNNSQEEDATEQKGEEIKSFDAIEDVIEVEMVENKIDSQALASNAEYVTANSSQEDETTKERLEQEMPKISVEGAAEIEVQVIEEDNEANVGPSAGEEMNEANFKRKQEESDIEVNRTNNEIEEQKTEESANKADLPSTATEEETVTEYLKEAETDEVKPKEEVKNLEMESIESNEEILQKEKNEDLLMSSSMPQVSQKETEDDNLDKAESAITELIEERSIKEVEQESNNSDLLLEEKTYATIPKGEDERELTSGETSIEQTLEESSAPSVTESQLGTTEDILKGPNMDDTDENTVKQIARKENLKGQLLESTGEETVSYSQEEDATEQKGAKIESFDAIEDIIGVEKVENNIDSRDLESNTNDITAKSSQEDETTKERPEEEVQRIRIEEAEEKEAQIIEEDNTANFGPSVDEESNEANLKIEQKESDLEANRTNKDIEEQKTGESANKADLPSTATGEETVIEYMKEVETDEVKPKEEVNNLETESIQNIDTKCHIEEEIHQKKSNEDLVVSSSMPQVSQKETEDENLDKAEAAIIELIEERSIKEVEQESNSSDPLLEEKTYATIPKGEDERELTSGEMSISYLLEQTLEESLAPSVTESQLGTTEMREIIDGNTETIENTNSNVKSLATAETTEEKLEKKENGPMDPIEDTVVELKDIEMDDVNADENPEPVEPLELESSIGLVAEDKGNETYLEITQTKTDEDKQNVNKQNLEATEEEVFLASDTTSEEKIHGEISQKGQNESEEVESISEAEPQIDRAGYRIKEINDVVLTEEVLGEAEKATESEYINEQIAEEESCPSELQMTSSSDQEPNKVKSSDLVPTENHEAAGIIENTEIEELQEIEDTNWEPEASSIEKSPEEEKMEGTEKPVIITRSASEPSEENIEEVGNHGDGAETAPALVVATDNLENEDSLLRSELTTSEHADINKEATVVVNPDIDQIEVEELNITDTEPIREITETAKLQDIKCEPEASPIAEAPAVEILEGTEKPINFTISESALSEASTREENIEESGSHRDKAETAAETSSEEVQLANESTRDLDTAADDNDLGSHITLEDEAVDTMELQDSSVISEVSAPEHAEINNESVVVEKSATDEVEELKISDVKPIIGNTETAELQVVEDINREAEASSTTKAPEEEIMDDVEKTISITSSASELSEQNTRHETMEEVGNHRDGAETAQETVVTAETSSEGVQQANVSARNLETTAGEYEAVDSIEVQEVDNLELQDSSVISQLASVENADVNKETMVVEESATDETEVEELKISNTETNLYGQNAHQIHESEKISSVTSSNTNTYNDEAGEETVWELEEKTCTTIPKGEEERELTSGETSIEQTLEKSSAPSVPDSQLGTTEVSDTVDGNTEIIENSNSYVQSLVTAETTEEKLEKKENEPMDAIEDTPVELKNIQTGGVNVEEQLLGEAEKAEESEYINEQITEGSCAAELQKTSLSDQKPNKVTSSDLVTTENHEAAGITENTEIEELQETGDTNWEAEASSIAKVPEEEKMEGAEKPVIITRSVSGPSEENIEEVGNHRDGAETAVDTMELQDSSVISELTTLEHAEMNKEPVVVEKSVTDEVEELKISDLKPIIGNTETAESQAVEDINQEAKASSSTKAPEEEIMESVDSLELQDSSVISQLASVGHAHLNKETMVVEESATDETEVEELEISNAETNLYGQNDHPINESEISTVNSDTNTYEEETSEVFESKSEVKYQVVEAVAEGNIVPKPTHSAEDLTEQFEMPSSGTLLREQELQTTTTTEKVEDESPMKEETLLNAKLESPIATNPKEETCLPSSEVEISTLDLEILDKNGSPGESSTGETEDLQEARAEEPREVLVKSEETEMKEEQTQVAAMGSREKENLEEKLIKEDETIDDDISSKKTTAGTEDDEDSSVASLELSQEPQAVGENKDSTDEGVAVGDTYQDLNADGADSSSYTQETEKERNVEEALTRLDLQETDWNDTNVETKSPNQEIEGVTVKNGEAKKTEDIKEEFVEEDSCITEIQTTSEETTNEITYSDPEAFEKLESKVWSMETKVEELKATEDLNLESEASSITEITEKEMKQGTQNPVNITSSVLEVSVEEIGEEKIKEAATFNGNIDTQPVTLISEIRLEEDQEAEKLIEGFNTENRIEKAEEANDKIEDTHSSEKVADDEAVARKSMATDPTEELSGDLPWNSIQGKSEENVAGAGEAIVNSNQDLVIEGTANENISQDAGKAKNDNELPCEVETQETANQTDCVESGVETIVPREETTYLDSERIEITEATVLTAGTEIENLRAEDLNSKSEADKMSESNENFVNITSPVVEVAEEDIREERVEADSITDTPSVTLVKETSSEEVQQGEQLIKGSENAETREAHMSQEDEEVDSVKLEEISSMVTQISREQHAFIGTEVVTAEKPNANEAEAEEIITSDRSLASIGQDPKDVFGTDQVQEKMKSVPDSIAEEKEDVKDFMSSAPVPIEKLCEEPRGVDQEKSEEHNAGAERSFVDSCQVSVAEGTANRNLPQETDKEKNVNKPPSELELQAMGEEPEEKAISMEPIFLIEENRETVPHEELITTYEYVAKDQIDEPLPDTNSETEDSKDQNLESTVERIIEQDFQEVQSEMNKEVGHKLEEENEETKGVNETKKDVFLMDDKSQEAVEEIHEVEEIVDIKEEITEGGTCTEELKATTESDENLSKITNSDTMPTEKVEEIRSSVNTEEAKLLTAEDFSGELGGSFASKSPEDENQGIKKTTYNINSESEESKPMVKKENLEKADADMKKDSEILDNPDADETEVEKYKEHEIEVQINGQIPTAVSIGENNLEEKDFETELRYQADETDIEGGKVPDLTHPATNLTEKSHESSSSEMIRSEQDRETTTTINKDEDEDESEKKDGTLVTEVQEDSLASRIIEVALLSKENPKEVQVSQFGFLELGADKQNDTPNEAAGEERTVVEEAAVEPQEDVDEKITGGSLIPGPIGISGNVGEKSEVQDFQKIEEVLEYKHEAPAPNTVTESEVAESEEMHPKTATIALMDEENQSQIANEKTGTITKKVSSDKATLDKEVAEDSLLLSADEEKIRSSSLKDELETLDYPGEITNQKLETAKIWVPTEEPSHELENAGEIKNVVSLGDRNVSEILLEEIKDENCLNEAPAELNLQERSNETGCRDINTEDKNVIEERNVSKNKSVIEQESNRREVGEEKIMVDEKKERTDKKEDRQSDKAQTDEGERVLKDEEKEEEGDENEKVDSGSDGPVMVEVARDVDVKVCKKSHGILSGVGSKVKHSISKVKKVITGKSSHPKSSSPK